MPVKRRAAKVRDDYPRPWENRPVSLERWQRHREQMMAREHPGRRPEEWWTYESPLGALPTSDKPQCLLLYEMGELREDELAALMPERRKDWEHAQEPDFFYCGGPGKWLEGRAAQKAHYLWAGIPEPVLAQFEAEARDA